MFKYRVDLVLSYWVFIWYLFYYFGFIKANPKLALILALIANLFILSHKKLIGNITSIRFILFVIIQTIIKLIPLYTLRNVKINFNEDVNGVIVITLLYSIWLYINNKTPLDIYENNFSPITDLIIDLLNKKD
jgi:hypothetical protein